jgi:hypothetical protein
MVHAAPASSAAAWGPEVVLVRVKPAAGILGNGGRGHTSLVWAPYCCLPGSKGSRAGVQSSMRSVRCRCNQVCVFRGVLLRL